ncbi:MAG: translation initiation factor IF-2 [Chloroflexota bacterium]|nr:translation initiation factor IF-2 [Chloroflexota bacterium]
MSTDSTQGKEKSESKATAAPKEPAASKEPAAKTAAKATAAPKEPAAKTTAKAAAAPKAPAAKTVAKATAAPKAPAAKTAAKAPAAPKAPAAKTAAKAPAAPKAPAAKTVAKAPAAPKAPAAKTAAKAPAAPKAPAAKAAAKGPSAPEPQPVTEAEDTVQIPSSLTVKQLAELLEEDVVDVIKQLMRNGVMANINEVIDHDTAAAVATAFDLQVAPPPRHSAPGRKGERYLRFSEDDTSVQRTRPPVVTIMGHVDHGKTSLLDAIRKTNVTATEAGEITQHIGAYQVEVADKKITFLDTPGHEAFTAMRARGARVTDIAILVVAADDGVMPQTQEAIDHARAAGVPIVVAINKIDKPNANPQRVKQQLADHGLLIEEWGGEVVCVEVSAKSKDGIPDLLENLLLVAEIEELKANPERSAVGVVIEAQLDKTKGSLTTVLVQSGTLKVGEPFTVGDTWGKVKAMFNDKGKRLRKAEPAMPVKIMGAESVPQAGDIFTVTASDREARTIAQRQQQETRLAASPPRRGAALSDLSSQIREGQVKQLNMVLKTDVQGSIEPVKASLERLSLDEVKVNILHTASGGITEGDVLLALASKGIVIGFNTGVEPGARQLADAEGVDIRCYDVIYNLVDDVEKALKGMLAPTFVDVVEGHGEVRAAFSLSRSGKIAGTYIQDGKVMRSSLARVRRGDAVILDSTISSLKRFKDDVREVATGYECGIGIEGYSDIQVGDTMEFYRREREGR